MTDNNDHYTIKVKGVYGSEGARQNISFLHVREGLIQAISEHMPDRSGDRIVDLGNLMVSPCFCDYHLHFSGKMKDSIEALSAVLLRHGIACAYEGGDKELSGLSMKENLNKMPEILTSGYALYKNGGYGGAIGRGVDTLSDAYAAIDELLFLPVDYLKIIHSGVYNPVSGLISKGGFDAAELISIVDYARQRGLDVYCHVNGETAVREAVDAGVSAIVHGLYAHDDTFAEMAEKKIAFIPTVNAFESLSAIAKTDSARQKIAETVDTHLSAVSRAFHKKVPVLPGSDSGPAFIPYGSAYIGELRLFLKAGIPLEDVIQSAAVTVLTEGTSADFVMLDGLSVRQVISRGRLLL